jgi:GH43 family beta-xylosidase
MPTIPKTVYKTPEPEARVSECYTIFADDLPEATDEAKCWVVKEIHGYWDQDEPDPKKKFKNKATSLSPTDPKHCVTIHEAHDIIDGQVLHRAKSGFKYVFMLDMFGPPHKRFEIMPDGKYRAMPLT